MARWRGTPRSQLRGDLWRSRSYPLARCRVPALHPAKQASRGPPFTPRSRLRGDPRSPREAGFAGTPRCRRVPSNAGSYRGPHEASLVGSPYLGSTGPSATDGEHEQVPCRIHVPVDDQAASLAPEDALGQGQLGVHHPTGRAGLGAGEEPVGDDEPATTPAGLVAELPPQRTEGTVGKASSQPPGSPRSGSPSEPVPMGSPSRLREVGDRRPPRTGPPPAACDHALPKRLPRTRHRSGRSDLGVRPRSWSQPDHEGAPETCAAFRSGQTPPRSPPGQPPSRSSPPRPTPAPPADRDHRLGQPMTRGRTRR